MQILPQLARRLTEHWKTVVHPASKERERREKEGNKEERAKQRREEAEERMRQREEKARLRIAASEEKAVLKAQRLAAKAGKKAGGVSNAVSERDASAAQALAELGDGVAVAENPSVDGGAVSNPKIMSEAGESKAGGGAAGAPLSRLSLAVSRPGKESKREGISVDVGAGDAKAEVSGVVGERSSPPTSRGRSMLIDAANSMLEDEEDKERKGKETADSADGKIPFSTPSASPSKKIAGSPSSEAQSQAATDVAASSPFAMSLSICQLVTTWSRKLSRGPGRGDVALVRLGLTLAP